MGSMVLLQTWNGLLSIAVGALSLQLEVCQMHSHEGPTLHPSPPHYTKLIVKVPKSFSPSNFSSLLLGGAASDSDPSPHVTLCPSDKDGHMSVKRWW